MAPIRQQPPAMRDRIARNRRDASLARVGSITKWVGAGIVTTVGVLGLYVGKALPGHHASSTSGLTSTSAPTSTSTSTSVPALSPSASGPATPGTTSPAASPSLTPPTNPPVRTSAPAPVVSGAS